jgi:hypothetical protein
LKNGGEMRKDQITKKKPKRDRKSTNSGFFQEKMENLQKLWKMMKKSQVTNKKNKKKGKSRESTLSELFMMK